jgi:hypothetical protein
VHPAKRMLASIAASASRLVGTERFAHLTPGTLPTRELHAPPRRVRGPSLRRVLLPVAVLAAAVSSLPAQTLKMPRVDLDYDAGADFSSFRTFSWKEPLAAAKDSQTHTRIVWYVERELEKKGLRKAEEGQQGDLLVRYYVKGRESLKGTPSQTESRLPGGTGSLTTSVDFSKILGATLLIELQRASDGKPVWRAASEYESVDKKRLDAETASAVRMLLAKYPPPAP